MLKDMVIIAKFGRPFGVKGQIKIISYCEPKSNILTYDTLYVLSSSVLTVLNISDKKVFSDDKIIFKLADYDTPESVRLLTNTHIYINRHDMPNLDSGQYYWNDLEGLEVRNISGLVLGVVE